MSWKIVKAILLFAILAVIAAVIGSRQKTSSQLVMPAIFSKLVKDEDNFLLDVHVPEQTHIPGTDRFIPFDKIAENLDQLPADKNTNILVYCRSGSMSKIAAQKILELGYSNVYDLKGGIDGYRESNPLPAVAPKP